MSLKLLTENVQKPWTNAYQESILCNGDAVVQGNLILEGIEERVYGEYTQTGALNNPVTIDRPTGIITTVSSVLAAAGSDSFAVQSGEISVDEFAKVHIVGYTGTDGFPMVYALRPTAGEFVIRIVNAGPAAFNGAFEIYYELIGKSA